MQIWSFASAKQAILVNCISEMKKFCSLGALLAENVLSINAYVRSACVIFHSRFTPL